MIEITKRGELPKDKKFEMVCYHCKTEFIYQQSDVKSEQRDGDYVPCPVCKKFLAHIRN